MTNVEAAATEEHPGFAGVAAVLLALASLPLAVVAARDPEIALAAFAGLSIVIAAAARPDLALLLLVATVPIESSIRISSNPDLTVVKLAGLLCFASFGLNALAARRPIYLDLSHAILWLLLGIALVSMTQARVLPDAVTTTLRYIGFIGLFFVVTQFVGDHALQRRIAWVLSISSASAALLAVQNFLSGGFSLARPRYGDANDLAFVLATTLPLTFWLLSSSWWKRLAVVAMIGVISSGLILSFSRGGLLGIGVGGVWHVAANRRHLAFVLAGGIVALLAVFLFVRTNQREFSEGLYAKRKVSVGNVESRLVAWNAALDLAASHPLMGVGPGNFQHYYAEAIDRPPLEGSLTVVHNAYLDVAAELGVIAMLLFVWYLVLSFRRLSESVAARRGPQGLAAAVRTSLVVAAVGALTLSEQYYAPFWLLGALATAIWHEGRTVGNSLSRSVQP